MHIKLGECLFVMKRRKVTIVIALLILAAGMLMPQYVQIPVEGATSADYNPKAFWYYPWGKSITHKGVDVFAKEGTNVLTAVSGLVLAAGENSRGGNYVLVLGAKWRVHYYAHLKDVYAKPLRWVTAKTRIGTVGKTGNALTTPAHLHYSIVTLIPYPWRIDGAKQGWKKMFYLNPIDYLRTI